VVLQVLDQQMSSSNPLPSSFLTLLDSGRMNISPPGHCGYCESESEDEAKFSFSVNTLTILDYQALIDRGFRRSGSYIYRSELRQTCCPLLTIRLNAQNHKTNLTASQRKMMRRFNTFLESNVPDLLIKPIKTLTSSITKVIVDQEDNNMVEVRNKKEEKETIEETVIITCFDYSNFLLWRLYQGCVAITFTSKTITTRQY
jgi:arginyl-tRNA--protein-N-Asp/Glu arginylyltransferase